MSPDDALVWRDGTVKHSSEATVPIMSHALHYGTTVFEGLRAYDGRLGCALFRLDDHLDRLRRSAEAYGMRLPLSRDSLRTAVHEVVRAHGGGDLYVRPMVFRGPGSMALDSTGSTLEVAVAAWRLDHYFAGSHGVRVTVSPWARISPSSLVPRAKAAGHYLNSLLAKTEATDRGYDEAIMLDERGLVCEASAMNVFVVHGGRLLTPIADDHLLDGMTRDTIRTIATDLGIETAEQPLRPADLHQADEILLTGTGARIVPVGQLDDSAFHAPGPVTAALTERFEDVVRGRVPEHHGWLDPVGHVRAGAR
ncbi:branched-chain amino acid transaminase [Nonomuraea sp. NPDC003804]|uniref:branched-chain amino acid transaminase n=1 Tax=Nonomuraea sp. NPDC003804 TaxID=3154547 RepID=UPI0033AF9C24